MEYFRCEYVEPKETISMESESKIENTETFRKVLAEYTSLCRIYPFIRLKNDEPREIIPDDYCLSLPYQEPHLRKFILYVEMKARSFQLLSNRYRKVEKENDVPLHVRYTDDHLIMLDGCVGGISIQYLIFNKDNT